MVMLDPARVARGALASAGDDAAILLGGASPDRLDLSAQRAIDGAGEGRITGPALREAVASVTLTGRGGASFPLHRKLDAMLSAGGMPTVIVNLSESEPASAKDRTLGLLRPHLVLDGAALLAELVGATAVTLALHADERALRRSLDQALDERADEVGDDPRWSISEGPSGYVRGEAGAVADRVAGGAGLPIHRTIPLARRGPSGGPTLVSNAETVAQVAALSLHGISAFVAAGTPHCSGTRLVTMTGDVAAPGAVVEVVGSMTFGDLLGHAGCRQPPPYMLLGGYAGEWVTGSSLWDSEISDSSVGSIGAGLGCGMVGVVGDGRCPLDEVRRLTTYLAGESAGQCGPCVRGLPSLAAHLDRLCRSGRSSGIGRIEQLAGEIVGRGACSHPDATVAMVASALRVMQPEIERHRRRTCVQVGAARPIFPIPRQSGGRSSWDG